MPQKVERDETIARAVRALALARISRSEIARHLKCSKTTLYKLYREELDGALLEAKGLLAQSAWNMALSGEHPAVTIFMTKTQLGWREKDLSDSRQPITLNLVTGDRPLRLTKDTKDKAINE